MTTTKDASNEDEYFDIQNSFEQDSDSILNQNGVYVFSEEFSFFSVSRVIKFILSKNLQSFGNKPKYLTLVIMSNGGDLSACFALVDVMKGSSIPVHTVGIGSIASCGLFAFIAGAHGHRTITPNTSILSHQFNWGSLGKTHELIAMNEEMLRTEKRLINHIKHCTKLKTEEEIKTTLLPPSDVFLEAKDAVKFGIADNISSYYPYETPTKKNR
jgi:ATP-dependent Clp protease protease subunit